MSVAPLPLVIDSSKPFGAMSNQAVADLKAAVAAFYRLQAAAAATQSAYAAHIAPTPENGSEFEGAGSLFGVTPDADNVGNQGTAFLYAVNAVKGALDTFMSAAGGSITALDQGTTAT